MEVRVAPAMYSISTGSPTSPPPRRRTVTDECPEFTLVTGWVNSLLFEPGQPRGSYEHCLQCHVSLSNPILHFFTSFLVRMSS